MGKQELIDYINQQLKQRVSREDIKRALISQGSTNEEIDEAFNLAEEGTYSMSDSEASSVSKSSKIIIVVGIIIAVFALSVILWVFSNGNSKEKTVKESVNVPIATTTVNRSTINTVTKLKIPDNSTATTATNTADTSSVGINKTSYNNTNKTESATKLVTISGVATDDPISGATVQLQTLSGKTIATATTNSTGTFSFKISDNKVSNGYALSVTGGKIGGENFSGKLIAQYSTSDNKGTSNVTLITTLVSRLVAHKTSGSVLEKRNEVINQLVNIGVVRKGEWNNITPADVSLNYLRHDISIQGFDYIMNKVVTEIQDDKINSDNLMYFPRVYGGIVKLGTGDSQNNISVLPASSGKSRVNMLSFDRSVKYSYVRISGPKWLIVNSKSGLISYTTPDDITSSYIPFSIKVTNNTTNLGRTVNGKIYIMKANIVAQGLIGPKGGHLANSAGDISIDVPAGTVSVQTNFAIITARDAENNVIIRVRYGKKGSYSSTQFNGAYTINLPDPNVLDANTPTTPVSK